MATIEHAQALAQALRHHQAGQLQLAEQIYRQIIDVDQGNATAWHYLGILAHQQGDQQKALDLLQRALVLSAHEASFHFNLGLVYQNVGQFDQAKECYRRAVSLRPGYFEALINMARMLAGTEPVDAITCYRQALHLAPNLPEIQVELGNALARSGHFHEAISSYRQAIALRPDLADAYTALGIALMESGMSDEAIKTFRQASQLQPDSFGAQNNLGKALCDRDELDEGIACYQRALELKPGFAEGHNNLGCALQLQGRVTEAIGSLRRAVELLPHHAAIHSNLVWTLPYCPQYDTEAIANELQQWNQQHAVPLARAAYSHPNDRSPRRRLRVGYVSPDFSFNVVGRFFLPLLEAHDHGAFEIYGYASVRAPDEMTKRLRGLCDDWRDALALDDEQLARVIHEDNIDILVDLTMHSKDNRLLAFARKPAPVQVTYLSYPGSTGLTAMDYRLTDQYLEPTGCAEEQFYVERSIRLPETFWCYQAPFDIPLVKKLPAASAGHITFGCLNNFGKVSEPALLAWLRLLQFLPESRLLLSAKRGRHRDRVRQLFAANDVSPERVRFVDRLGMIDYFRIYDSIDVALDPFPHCGGTTTCDALWMGVPVVSLIGKTAAGRGGWSILSNAGLPELAAKDTSDYVQRALALANDQSRLNDLRATLRKRLRESPLMDVSRFTRHVEAAYRSMWHAWCKK